MHIRSCCAVTAGLLALAACSPPGPDTVEKTPTRLPGSVYVVRDTTVQSFYDANGVAQPLRQATLSTKLMGSVVSVYVKEGDAVTAGQPLVRIDARDLTAKQAQVAASIADAQAIRGDAALQAARIRALYTDSAATRAQLDAAETGLTRADAGLHAARASAAELGAMSAYAHVQAPFAGIVTRRFVDPGAFAAPGAPLVTVQDGRQLRISASVTPDIARQVRRAQVLKAAIDGVPVTATVEGVVPAATGNLYTINALVTNADGASLSGSTATLSLPQGPRAALVVPGRAISRSGDLTGVTVRTRDVDERRWVRIGRTMGDVVEVLSGLRAGDIVVVPPPAVPLPDGGR